MNIIWK